MNTQINTASLQIPSPADIVHNSSSINNGDSIFSYFWNSGFLIKTVIISLLVASIYSWAIIISKYIKIKRVNKDGDYFEEEFWSGTPLDMLYKQLRNSSFDPMTNVFCAAMAEWEQANVYINQNNVKYSLEQRIDRAMQIAIKKEINDLEKGLTFLSTVGSNGVIVGLFGTVVGILNGFKVIATQQSASIATVGPVISEALFTTAFGILTSIPAAIAYNKYMDEVNRYINRLEVFADELSSIITRQCNEN